MASYTNLNLTRLGDAALQQFVKTLAPLMSFSRSFSPVAVASMRGNVIAVPLVGTMAATTFGGAYNICGGTKTVVTITLNRHKIVHVGQSDIDALNNSDSGLDSFGYEQGAALATAVIEDILGVLVTTLNFGLAGQTTAANLDLVQLRGARLSLNIGNCPMQPRSCLIDAVGMDALLGVTNFIQAQMYKDNAVLQEGRVLRALGFDFYELNGSFASAYSINAFFCHPSAIAVAMRYVEPQSTDGYWAAEQMSDPTTGISFGMRGLFDILTGQNYLCFEANYGYSAGITNGGRIVKRLD